MNYFVKEKREWYGSAVDQECPAIPKRRDRDGAVYVFESRKEARKFIEWLNEQPYCLANNQCGWDFVPVALDNAPQYMNWWMDNLTEPMTAEEAIEWEELER